MWCRLVIIRDERNIDFKNDYTYMQYYLCDLKSKRAVAYRYKSPLGVDDCDVQEDFNYDSFIKRAKEQHSEQRKGTLLKEQDIELYDDFFEKMFKNYQKYAKCRVKASTLF